MITTIPNEEDIYQITEWIKSDEIGKSRLESYADIVFLKKILIDDKRLFRFVEHNGDRIGFFDIDIADGWFSFYVEPQSRGREYAKSVIQHVVECARHAGVKVLHAGVEEDNKASLKIMKSTGFRKVSEDNDLVEFEMVVS